MAETISFLRPHWGHAIHRPTFREVSSWLDRLLRRSRYSVMVHSASNIRIGDFIEYMGEGGKRRAKVTDVDWCLDPKDMATLEILVSRRNPS